jgi:hypothetical protein
MVSSDRRESACTSWRQAAKQLASVLSASAGAAEYVQQRVVGLHGGQVQRDAHHAPADLWAGTEVRHFVQ